MRTLYNVRVLHLREIESFVEIPNFYKLNISFPNLEEATLIGPKILDNIRSMPMLLQLLPSAELKYLELIDDRHESMAAEDWTPFEWELGTSDFVACHLTFGSRRPVYVC